MAFGTGVNVESHLVRAARCAMLRVAINVMPTTHQGSNIVNCAAIIIAQENTFSLWHGKFVKDAAGDIVVLRLKLGLVNLKVRCQQVVFNGFKFGKTNEDRLVATEAATGPAAYRFGAVSLNFFYKQKGGLIPHRVIDGCKRCHRMLILLLKFFDDGLRRLVYEVLCLLSCPAFHHSSFHDSMVPNSEKFFKVSGDGSVI